MKTTVKTLTIAATAAFFISFQSSFGATTNVIVGPGGTLTFSPANVVISTGDSVIWQWAGGIPHSTTSGTNGVHSDDNGVPSGLWDSGVTSTAGHTFTNTFTSAGTFSYYCSLHFGSGMLGDVVVASVALPPTIGVTNPVSGAVFAAPANVTAHAAVTNGSGTVTNVEFLVNSALLANVTTAPFAATANNLAAGSYTLTAIAQANNNLSATNSVTISVVTPITTILAGPLESGAGFQFRYPANVGLDYVVQRSTNFSAWVTLATNTAASNPIVFLDVHGTNGINFYRVGRLPNP